MTQRTKTKAIVSTRPTTIPSVCVPVSIIDGKMSSENVANALMALSARINRDVIISGLPITIRLMDNGIEQGEQPYIIAHEAQGAYVATVFDRDDAGVPFLRALVAGGKA